MSCAVNPKKSSQAAMNLHDSSAFSIADNADDAAKKDKGSFRPGAENKSRRRPLPQSVLSAKSAVNELND
jgi:hypothetical protein